MNIIDVGWVLFVIIIWGFVWIFYFLFIMLIVNVVMFVMKKIDIFDVDIFDIWYLFIIGFLIKWYVDNNGVS